MHILILRVTNKKISQKVGKIQLRDKMFQNRTNLVLLPNWSTILNEIQCMLSQDLFGYKKPFSSENSLFFSHFGDSVCLISGMEKSYPGVPWYLNKMFSWINIWYILGLYVNIYHLYKIIYTKWLKINFVPHMSIIININY